ncbi:MAG: DUF3127 domain-containing protein [Salinivirgaceae bacterium]|jgi:single-stranded DNA-binding protein|nr:DUF3127 domain-containing protein [Salinivirgaceae bacterium]
MELIGKLEEVRPAIQRTATFTVREFVLEVENQRNAQWNDHILFQVSNNNVGLLDSFSIGQMIKVTFDIQGRRWTGQDGTQRVFNTLSAWRLESAENAQAAAPTQPTAAPTAQPAAAPTQPAAPSQPTQNGDIAPVDDLPF